MAALLSNVITHAPMARGSSTMSPPRWETTRLVKPLQPPCTEHEAGITLRLPAGCAAGASLVPLVTVDDRG